MRQRPAPLLAANETASTSPGVAHHYRLEDRRHYPYTSTAPTEYSGHSPLHKPQSPLSPAHSVSPWTTSPTATASAGVYTAHPSSVGQRTPQSPPPPPTPRSFYRPAVSISSNNSAFSLSSQKAGSPKSSTPRFSSMFRLGSRAKSPRRAASSATSAPHGGGGGGGGGLEVSTPPPLPTNAGGYFALVPPGSPTASQTTPWPGNTSASGADSSLSTSPRASSSRRSASGSGGHHLHHHNHHHHINTAGVIPRKKSHSPSSSLSNSITPSSATASHSFVTDMPLTMPVQKSSKSFLGRRLGKSQQPQEPEFDPTTFRKNRTRPVGPRGADAVYQEYDDLFNDDDEDDELGVEEEDEEVYDDGQAPNSSMESNDDFLLLQTEEQPELGRQQSLRPRLPRSSSSKDVHQQQQGPPRLFPRSSSLASLNQASPPRDPARAPTSYPSGSISPFPPTSKPWPQQQQRPFNTTTPPRSTAPSVDESLDHLPPPPSAVGAPPTPPLPSATKHNHLSIDTNASGDDSQRTPPTPPPSSLPQNLRSSSSDIRLQERSIPEGLGVDIPSPTLFLPISVHDRWGDASPREVTYSPLLATTYDPAATNVSSRTFGEDTGIDATARPPLKIDTGSSSTGSEAGTIRGESGEEQRLSARNSQASRKSVESPHGNLKSDTGNRMSAASSTGQENTSTVASAAVQENVATSTSTTSTIPDTAAAAAAVRQDTAHLRAFRNFIKASGNNDAFVSRGPRYDAFQAQRICTHLPPQEDPTCPLGGGSRASTSTNPSAAATPKAPKSKRKATPSGSVPRDPAEEIMTGLWALMALRWLNFGKVMLSPAHGMLLAASAKTLTRRATMKHDDRAAKMLAEVTTSPGSIRRGSAAGVPWKLEQHEKRRVLDLGGIPVADWGWHCAMDYPKARVITATTPLATPIPTTLRGPRNHRHVTIPSLTALPFPSNHFDVVSARFLFLQLRVSDFDPCLSECLRVLKPGGFLEFTVIDHDIINAGPLAEELVGKFADRLRNDQRDPEPSRRWIKRLDDAGFEDVKRMWMVLPMAAAPVKPGTTNSGQRPGSSGTITASTPASAVTEPTSAISRRVDPVQEDLRRRMKVWEGLTDDENNDDQDRDDDDDDENCGSTKDIAGITGLIGGWCWEKWVHGMGLKEEEMVGKVMDEAKGYGSGWRCLMGYARKPLGMISPPGAAEGDAQQAASAVEAEDADDVDDV